MPGSRSPFGFMRRRRRSGGPGPVVAGAVILLAAAGGVAWWLLRSSDALDPGGIAVESDSALNGPADVDVPQLDLPPLDLSDEIVRQFVSRVSAHPRLASWLVTDDLVRRFVGAVVSLAGGRSPSSELEFMVPEESLHVQESPDGLVIDPASHGRYDLLSEVIVSLDTRGSATLYRQLHPLFEEAHAELGLGERTWDEAVELAVRNVLAARVPPGPVRVIEVEGVYVFADPAIEASSPAEKHLMRLGPQNAARVQAKVRELAGAIGI
jgi:hypothetical protein